MSDQNNENAAQPSPVELTRKWFELVWNQKDETAIHKMMCSSCIARGIGLEKTGPEGFIPFYKNFMAAFDDIHIEVIDITGDDQSAAGHCLFSGIHKKSGKNIRMEFSVFTHWKNGLLVDARNILDFLSLLEQIGEIDKTTLVSALQA